MFALLGLNSQEPFAKAPQPRTVEAIDSELHPLDEKPRWTRPGHTIERNELAKQKAKIERIILQVKVILRN